MEGWVPVPKILNKMIKSYKGNRKSCVSLMHWNLGSCYWDKKKDDVQHLADQFSPDYLFISEANLFQDTPESQTNIEGYNLVKVKTMSRLKFSRMVLLCKEGVQYTVQPDLMNDEVSSKWIKIRGCRIKSLLIGGRHKLGLFKVGQSRSRVGEHGGGN